MGHVAGQTVVHPKHGPATVQGVVRKDTGDGPEDYVELRLPSPSSLTILIPERSLQDVGVRSVSTRAQAEAVLAVLGEPSDVPETWAERNRVTVSRMGSGDLAQIAMVVRDLTRHAQRAGKSLSLGEGRTLDGCLDTLSDELSLALGLSRETTMALVVDSAVTPEQGRRQMPAADGETEEAAKATA